MPSTTRPLLRALALSCLLLPAAARVVWIPEEFDPLIESNRLTPRQETTCGGDSSLTQCGGDFPQDFCCPSGMVCLALQTAPSITASICCPAGQDCRSIGPVGCDQQYQNATLVPSSQLHSEPTVELDICGDACCPMGYKCQGDRCVALPSKSSSTTSASPATATSKSIPAASSTLSADSTTSPIAGAAGASTGHADQTEPSDSFNSRSFAAGFVPGLVIGALVCACLILLFLRRKRNSSGSSSSEKGNRDTLTDLSASPDYRPTMHGRSISEPVVDPRFGNRNDFLRGSPPRQVPPSQAAPLGNSVDIHSEAQRPVTPGRTPRIKALFSHSPFMVPQTPSTPPTAPVPAHLKRGTLSFKISPVRALKKQKSMHSLRRQMTEVSQGISRSNSRPRLDRSDSQETILVQLTGSEPYTPDQAPPMPQNSQTLGSAKYRPHDSASTWISDSATSDDDTPDERAHSNIYQSAPLASSSSRPVANPTYETPTRPPVNPSTSALGSPYTPRNQGGKAGNGLLGAGLRVDRRAPEDTRRDTTFSAMMERAGLRRSDLLPVPPVPKMK